MSTDIWFRDDIANILRSVAALCRTSVSTMRREDEFIQGYQEGFAAALWSVAVALGVDGKLLDSQGVDPRPWCESRRKQIP
ncbi:MAG: hypothetical protein H5T64_09110 [Chloroflexi bacterium]|nr:hypothetical protein [Chloroflexota bacterium]